jgi:hypothetical protein
MDQGANKVNTTSADSTPIVKLKKVGPADPFYRHGIVYGWGDYTAASVTSSQGGTMQKWKVWHKNEVICGAELGKSGAVHAIKRHLKLHSAVCAFCQCAHGPDIYCHEHEQMSQSSSNELPKE